MSPTYSDHEHWWEPRDRDEQFFLEDGAAIFIYSCTWAPIEETAHSERLGTITITADQECGEQRAIRLEPEDADEEDIEEIEIAWNTGGEVVELLEVDPPEPEDKSGELVVKHEDRVVTYSGP